MSPDPAPDMDALGIRGDRGSAPIEFIFGTLILLLPLVYITLSFSVVQGASFAAEAAAVDAARTAARFPAGGEARAREHVRMHFADFGLADASWDIETTCAGRCDRPGTLVTARITAHVHPPGLGLLFGRSETGTIVISAAHTDQVAPAPGELGDD